MSKHKTEDDFDRTYTCDWDKKHERYEDDFIAFYEQHPRRVWTLVECDDEKYFLCAGLHIVNAVYYLTTKEDYKEKDEQYFIFESEVSDD